ncbi:hypothetical protein Zmor_010254 [Zophobas morio]|uniref:Uncharacterized protein n=1 Tax=Zophobas morio TaxID=2755281 RepID=A0AA38IP30_9CUCU|nr:hypothetical protein Zmor_010254 [Zophobas morio]
MTRNPIFFSFAVYTFPSNKAPKRPSFSFSIIQMHLSKRFIFVASLAEFTSALWPFLRLIFAKRLCSTAPIWRTMAASDLFTVIRVIGEGTAGTSRRAAGQRHQHVG